MACARHSAQSGIGRGAAAHAAASAAPLTEALTAALTEARREAARVPSGVTCARGNYATSFQRSVSPARSGTMPDASRYGSDSGTVHSSRKSVTVPLLRGKP